MRNIREEVLRWVHVGSIVIIWSALLYLTGNGLAINWEAVKKLPDVVTVYVILSYAFTKWFWRWQVFKGWLVPFPDLEGTWQGELASKWENPITGNSPPRIPIVLVIRQSFSSISCVMYTRESESYSTAAQMDDATGILRLNYNYTNRPKATIRDRSAIHDGAASLRIISFPEIGLEGEYWTSRCTTGDIKLKYRSKQLIDDFPNWLL
jgi:SMODS-associating 2TM, beta-strand rich effector domain